jgi:hypothetical protein
MHRGRLLPLTVDTVICDDILKVSSTLATGPVPGAVMLARVLVQASTQYSPAWLPVANG